MGADEQFPWNPGRDPGCYGTRAARRRAVLVAWAALHGWVLAPAFAQRLTCLTTGMSDRDLSMLFQRALRGPQALAAREARASRALWAPGGHLMTRMPALHTRPGTKPAVWLDTAQRWSRVRAAVGRRARRSSRRRWPTGALRWDVNDGRSSAMSVLESVGLEKLLTGEQPHVRETRLREVDKAVELVPDRPCGVLGELVGERYRVQVVAGDGWRLLVLRHSHGSASVVVTAVNPALVDSVLDELRTLAPAPEPDNATVPIELWGSARTGARNWFRQIQAPRWQDITRNYPAGVRDDLATLMAAAPPEAGGKLLLWNGPPGTGKTTAIRALARMWSEWATMAYVTDGERLFADPDYLLSVVLADGGYAGGQPRKKAAWRVIVVEDADEFLQVDTSLRTHAALGRLLNMTDGIPGAGLNVLVLLTANQPLPAGHPAGRAGRCLADIRFRPFNTREAASWLGPNTLAPAGDTVLADLFRLRGDITQITPDPPEQPGLYL